MKKLVLALIVGLVSIFLSACSEADIASENTSKAADNFEIERRIVFFNGITDTYLLEIVGLCSLGNYDDVGQLSVTCKVGNHQYKKHFLGLSDNVSYFVEQLRPASVSGFHYRVIFRPEAILPNPDLATSLDQNLPKDPTKPDIIKRGGASLSLMLKKEREANGTQGMHDDPVE